MSNRRYFDALLDKEFRRAQREEQPLGLVLLDIDNFKGFNDRYGHLGGDDCLRRVSRCICEAMRRPDDHVARYGGEELVILLPATDASGCAAVAEYVRGVVECLRIEHAGSRYGMVTISAGAAAAHPYGPGWTPSVLIKAADIALYQAKAAGRNCVRLCNETVLLATVNVRATSA